MNLINRCTRCTLLLVITLTPLFHLAAQTSTGKGNPAELAGAASLRAALRPPTPLKVSLTKSLFSKNEQVQVVVETPATVLVSSDLSKSTTQFDIFGAKTITVGPIQASGYYTIEFTAGDARRVIQALFLEQGSRLEAVPLVAPVVSSDLIPPAQIVPAMEKFLRNINSSRIGRAYAAAKSKFPSENAIALGNTVVICLITLPTGAWVACATTVGGLAIDFALKLNDELLDVLGPTKDKVLTAAEVDLLKKSIGSLKLIPDAYKMLFGKGVVDKVFGALKLGTGAGEVIVDNTDGKFAFKTTNEFVKKYEVIYSLKP